MLGELFIASNILCPMCGQCKSKFIPASNEPSGRAFTGRWGMAMNPPFRGRDRGIWLPIPAAFFIPFMSTVALFPVKNGRNAI